MRKFCFVVLLLASLLSVMPGTARGEAAQTIKIGAIFAQTGNAAPSNLFHLQGARFAIAELNARGGVLGCPVELVEFDNASTEIGSARAAEQAVARGVVAVIGASWSSHSLAAAPVLQAARIPMISPVSTHPQLTRVGDYIFRACFTDAFQGAAMAAFARQDLQAGSAAVLINAGSQYSLEIADIFKENFQRDGGRIVFAADYLPEDTDFTPHLRPLLAALPDVVFVPGYERDSGYIIRQARDLELTMPFLGGDGWGLAMFAEAYAGDDVFGNYCSTHWHEDDPAPANREFVRRYLAAHDTIESGGIPLAYDAVMLLADAIARAQSFAPECIRDALAAIHNFAGATGTITFDEFGDPRKPAVIVRFNAGRLEYVRTIEPEE